MPVELKTKTYCWLKAIGVFRKDFIPSKSEAICEVPFDEEIYLQNGYLIGVTLRKFVKPYGDEYQELLKVRKIATLKSSDNWEIIEPYLLKIGCDVMNEEKENGEVDISTTVISEILEHLYEEYRPHEQEKLALRKKNRCNYIDFYSFNVNKTLAEAENSLEFFCLLLIRNFKVNLGEALGLLVDQSKYLKQIIVEGSLIDGFESVKNFYADVTEVWPMLEEILGTNSSEIGKVLEGLAEGVISEKLEIIHCTLNLLSFVKDDNWFDNVGYFKLLSSTYIQCFYFTIERLTPHCESVLNENIHVKITDKKLLYTILVNIVKIIPKTIYSKEILQSMPISYFYDRCFEILNSDDIHDHPHDLIIKVKELLAQLIISFTDQVPYLYTTRILNVFQYKKNTNYSDMYHILALLFEILEALIIKESPLTQKLFNLCLNYLVNTFGEVKSWIIENIGILYTRLSRYFPLENLLMMYSLNPIAQASEYSLFDSISDNNSQLTTEEVTLLLNCLIKYIESQMNCKCFINIVVKIVGSSGQSKKFSDWAKDLCLKLIERMSHIQIPTVNLDILNPKVPDKKKVVASLGIKRKEMIKFKEFESCKQLLELLLQVQDRNFLQFYVNSLHHSIITIDKEVGHKKRELVNLYRSIKEKAKEKGEKVQESATMNDLVKEIMINRSALLQKDAEGHLETLQTPQWEESESRLISERDSKMGPIFEESNEFIDEECESSKKEVSKDGESVNIQGSVSGNSVASWESFSDKIILAFSEDNEEEEPFVRFYSNDILEQNEIIYIGMLKQKYEKLIVASINIYNQIENEETDASKFADQFLRKFSLTKIIKSAEFQEILIKSKINSKTKAELIENILIQSAFHAFGFKKNRRISVSCISSFFTLLEENLKQELMESASEMQRIKEVIPFAIQKNIQFDRELSPHIFPNSKPSSSFFLCFDVMSQIFNNALGIHLMEPISKMINKFSVPEPKAESSKEIAPEEEFDPHDKEISIIEGLISSGREEDDLVISNPNADSLSKYRFRKQKQKRWIPQDESIELNEKKATKKVDNKELKDKLAKRMKILEEEIQKGGAKPMPTE